MRSFFGVALALALAACHSSPQCMAPACTTPEISGYADVGWELATFDVSVCLDGTTCDQIAVPRDGSMVPLPNVGGWVSIAPQPSGSGSRITLTVFDTSGDGGAGLRLGDVVHVVVTDSSPPHDVICDMSGDVIAAPSGSCACGPFALTAFSW